MKYAIVVSVTVLPLHFSLFKKVYMQEWQLHPIANILKIEMVAGLVALVIDKLHLFF